MIALKHILGNTRVSSLGSWTGFSEQTALVMLWCGGRVDHEAGRVLPSLTWQEVQICLSRVDTTADRGLKGEPSCLTSMPLYSIYPFSKGSLAPSSLSKGWLTEEWLDKRMHCIPGTRQLIGCLSCFLWRITLWNTVVTNIPPRVSWHPLALLHSLS